MSTKINIKICTSYFYQVRFFTPNMLPMSTAMWDPKWYHDGKDQLHVFRDKRGIINGVRMPAFVPGDECHGLCSGPDGCNEKNGNEPCQFLKAYRDQLDSLDFKKVMKHLKQHAAPVIKADPQIIVLLFHEKPDNPCSERGIVQEWFKDHGVKVEELKYPIKDHY